MSICVNNNGNSGSKVPFPSPVLNNQLELESRVLSILPASELINVIDRLLIDGKEARDLPAAVNKVKTLFSDARKNGVFKTMSQIQECENLINRAEIELTPKSDLSLKREGVPSSASSEGRSSGLAAALRSTPGSPCFRSSSPSNSGSVVSFGSSIEEAEDRIKNSQSNFS